MIVTKFFLSILNEKLNLFDADGEKKTMKL